MMTTSNDALLALCAGNSLVTGESPSQRPVTRSFDVFCDLREAGDLRSHHAHYDVTVMGDMKFWILNDKNPEELSFV